MNSPRGLITKSKGMDDVSLVVAAYKAIGIDLSNLPKMKLIYIEDNAPNIYPFGKILKQLKEAHPDREFRLIRNPYDDQLGIEVKAGWLHWRQLDLIAMGLL